MFSDMTKDDLKQIIKESLKELIPDIAKELSFQTTNFKIPKSPGTEVDNRFCYWSASINKNEVDNNKMVQTLVTSARKVGVTQDFHVYSPDMTKLDGGTLHKVEPFDTWGCYFKLDLLLNEVSKLDYQYMVWLDADHYFVRKPKCLLDYVDNGLVMIPMENQINGKVKRDNWWGISIVDTIDIFREFGVKNDKIYSTNGGLFIVHKDFIKTFYNLCYDFRNIVKKKTGKDIVEEYFLAIIGNLFNRNIESTTQEALEKTWACDWTEQFTDKVPEGKEWKWENYLTGESKMVNSDIVHCMRGKKALVNKTWD